MRVRATARFMQAGRLVVQGDRLDLPEEEARDLIALRMAVADKAAAVPHQTRVALAEDHAPVLASEEHDEATVEKIGRRRRYRRRDSRAIK